MFSNVSGRQGMSIFNRRRRPRQAVYASPQRQSPTKPLQIDIPDEKLAEIAQDFENSPKFYDKFSANSESFASYQRQSTRPQQNGQQFTVVPMKHPNNQHYGNHNVLPKKPKIERDYCFKDSNQKFLAQQEDKSIPRTASFTMNNGNSRPINKPQNPIRKTFSFTEKNRINKPQQSYSGPQKGEFSRNSSSYAMINSSANATTRNGKVQLNNNGEGLFGDEMVNQDKVTRNGWPAVQNDAGSFGGETGFSLQTVDKSMKFLTSTINGTRKWSKFRDKIPLVFEIFATLDSVPTSNNNGTAKLFNMKDATGSSRCIYWEMDQKLPRMARGQIYRLVGALERRTGHFQCFTIRPAKASEQRLAKQQVQMCDDAMTKLVSMISES